MLFIRKSEEYAPVLQKKKNFVIHLSHKCPTF